MTPPMAARAGRRFRIPHSTATRRRWPSPRSNRAGRSPIRPTRHTLTTRVGSCTRRPTADERGTLRDRCLAHSDMGCPPSLRGHGRDPRSGSPIWSTRRGNGLCDDERWRTGARTPHPPTQVSVATCLRICRCRALLFQPSAPANGSCSSVPPFTGQATPAITGNEWRARHNPWRSPGSGCCHCPSERLLGDG